MLKKEKKIKPNCNFKINLSDGGWRRGNGGGGDVKKTSPMKGNVFFTGDIRTYVQTDGHRDSLTESAQWADSVKIKKNIFSKGIVILKGQYNFT